MFGIAWAIYWRRARLILLPYMTVISSLIPVSFLLGSFILLLTPRSPINFVKGITPIRIPSDWGLEIGVLSELHRNYSSTRICQVDIAQTYDHKHQNLSLEDQQQGLSKMSIDIAKSLFRKLATQGTVLTPESFRTLKATYLRIALDFVETYRNDAIINGLTFDIHKEEKAVEMFAKNIIDAGKMFLESPLETPFIPSWNRVQSAIPDIFERLHNAVEEDHKEFSAGN